MSKGPQPSTIYETDTPIAKALKRICNRKHISKVELAVALKVGLKKVYNMMNHNDYPEYEQMVILIKEFGVTTSDLFGPELSLKLHDNAEKYVDVTLACNKKPVVTNTEPPKPEPVPEPVPEPPKREKRSETQKKGLINKLTMLFSANNERR